MFLEPPEQVIYHRALVSTQTLKKCTAQGSCKPSIKSSLQDEVIQNDQSTHHQLSQGFRPRKIGISTDTVKAKLKNVPSITPQANSIANFKSMTTTSNLKLTSSAKSKPPKPKASPSAHQIIHNTVFKPSKTNPVTKKENKKPSCSYCGIVFSHHSSLSRHIRKQHGTDTKGSIKCNRCDKR